MVLPSQQYISWDERITQLEIFKRIPKAKTDTPHWVTTYPKICTIDLTILHIQDAHFNKAIFEPKTTMKFNILENRLI